VSTPASVLRDAFDRHTWATLRVLDHLETLDHEVFTQVVPGTYGQIDATLTHLADADTRYLDRLAEPDLPPIQQRPPQAIGTLRTEAQANAPRWSEVLDRLEAGTLRARIGPRDDDPGYDPAETLLVLQALHHADDHRAQVCSTLGALGLEVPDLDVWSFWDDQRRSR
jgi:uncharacterized damage-inducible protein DinB